MVEEKVHPASSQQPRLNGASYNQKKLIPPPATYRDAGRSRRRNRCCCCFIWILSVLATIVILLVIGAAVVYFLIHPKAVKYSLLDFQISQLNVTSNPSELTYKMSMTLQAYNPNKKIAFYYDNVWIFLSYEGQQIGQSSLAPFYQGHRNTTILESNLTGQEVNLQPPMASSLRAAIGKKSIPFSILVSSKAKVKFGKLKLPFNFKVKDNCNVAVSPPSTAGGAQLLSQSCGVKWSI